MKISLIIPTRERGVFLEHCLKTAMAIEDDNIEIVVSDNCSQDATPDILASIRDPRLVRTRSNRRLSMRQNFENGLAHATGDYVCFIGDDDGFLPRQFPFARQLLEQHRPDTMGYTLLRYAWPGAGNPSKQGTLRLEPTRVFGQPRFSDLAKMRRRVLSARVNWFEGSPDIYHGFVSRKYIESRRTPGADFFAAKVPDVYFAYLALLTGARHLFVPHTFTISGFTTSSTGASYQREAIQPDATSSARQFEHEAEQDSVRDPVNLGFGVPAVLLGTFISVTRQLGVTDGDLACWFSYVIRSTTNMAADQRISVIEKLEAFAKAEGLVAEWNKAQGSPARLSRSLYRLTYTNLSSSISRTLKKFGSFRVSTAPFADDTINGAALAIDAALGSTYSDVLSGTIDRQTAWRSAKRAADRQS